MLILSEPTRGMDVGAKEDVIRIVKSLRDRGVAVLVLSTEPETILTLADRVTVLKRGSVAREFTQRPHRQGRSPGRGDEHRSGHALIFQRNQTHRVLDMSVTTDTARPFNMKRFMAEQMRNIAPVFTLIVLVVFFATQAPSFRTFDNFMNILSQASITGIIAVGLTFVILTAEIDLSVAAIANAIGIMVAYFTIQPDYVNIANIPGAWHRRDHPDADGLPGARAGDRLRRHRRRHSRPSS